MGFYLTSEPARCMTLNRESRENRERSRRCNPFPLNRFNAGALGHMPLFRIYRCGKAPDGRGKPEDLPCMDTGEAFLEKEFQPAT